MKTSNFSFYILLATLFVATLLTSCVDVEEPYTCDSEALFLREDVTGTMFYLMCYDSWSIKLDETNAEGSHLFAASLDIPEAYQVDSLKVKIDACFYDFDLELLFPDPVIWGEMYVIKDYNLSNNL